MSKRQPDETEDIELMKDLATVDPEAGVALIPAERQQWGRKSEFMLACIGYAVGLGNVWRFPWLAQTNGGGAFLIPYVIMLFVEGIPLFYMELCIGQRMRCGPIPVWKKISPWSQGVGYGMCIASFLSSCFYNVIISWCIYYFFMSFQSPLPWQQCPEIDTNFSISHHHITKCKEIGATQYYWYYEALQIADSIDDHSGFAWKISLCLLLAWIVVALCMLRGIQTTGKVVYFTATFPYLVLLIFVIKGCTLEGFSAGLEFFFVPDWERLKEPSVWMAAAAQIFFSLGLAFGGLIAYASYNDEKNNCLQDAMIICFTNCGTSIFAGIAIFSILGYRATVKSNICHAEYPNNTWANCTVDYFLKKGGGGSGLAFVAFTEAINHLPVPTLFSILFFLMLITLGLGSMFGSLEGLVTSLRDMPFFQSRRSEYVILCVAIPGFLTGFGFTQYSGEYLVQLFNKFSIDIPILLVGFAELIYIVYVYGLDKFTDDIEYMTGRKPPYIFIIMWKYVSPAVMVVMLGMAFYDMIAFTPTYEAWDRVLAVTYTRPYPVWAIFTGVLVFVISFAFIPGGAIKAWYQRRTASTQTNMPSLIKDH